MNLTYHRNRLLQLFRHMPLKAEIIAMLNIWNRRRLARLKTPTNLIFFVTNRCNARCQHCFYWRNLNNAPAEISLEQIRTVVSSLRHRVDTLMLTGGEPLLRADLREIIDIFVRENRTRKIHLTTNGSLPDKLESLCREVVERLPCELSVQISLDGDEKYHNRLRGGDFYGRAIESLRRLQALAVSRKNLIVNAATTLNRDNLGQLNHLATTTQALGVSWGITLMRGTGYGILDLTPDCIQDYNPKDDACHIPSRDEIRAALALYFPVSEGLDLRTRLQNALWENTLLILEGKRALVRCVAGRADGVLYPNGDVALCEITKPVANLGDFDFDFYRLWHSPAAEARRSQIKRCSCIHGCHLVDSMKYDYRFLLR